MKEGEGKDMLAFLTEIEITIVRKEKI